MVRAPCCEKIGLKKGPWTAEEDQVLIAYIQKYGHENWRALPKQAGLLRCGKSCRLRWTNYLRPDIKRGNFSREEEEMIISLHESLGNRWSAIAARLPGRTDNEIKNVWHTHLKKMLKPSQAVKELKHKCNTKFNAKTKIESTIINLESGLAGVSPAHAYNDTLTSSTDSSIMTGENNNVGVSDEGTGTSLLDITEIDDSFWLDTLSMDDPTTSRDSMTNIVSPSGPLSELSFSSSNDGDRDFWLRVFMDDGSLQDLPEI